LSALSQAVFYVSSC